ncbi:MAG: acyl-CoA dehydrogenase [Pseudomonadota bacterium]
MPYRAPVSEMRFLLDHVVGADRLAETALFAEATPDTRDAILSEAAKLSDDVLAPTRRAGDLQPSVLENGVVRTAPEFAAAYRAIADGGWVGAAADPIYGGMGLPITFQTCIYEMMASANLALSICPMLSQGQIEALESHASDEIKAVYLPKLVSGVWTGTMNLTEPQAGSDVGAVRTKAEPREDGTHAITGAKIYISFGDHDLAENVCHLVLARLPNAPRGSKGISLFLVPKRIPDANGAPGVANRVRVVSLEHKMGLHGSPTCTMEFDAATGWLIGAPHYGLAAMFTMMNNARLGVGVQGISQAEAALQAALAFAQERRQGRTPSGRGDSISGHADVRRMLMNMSALTASARAIALDCAVSLDMAKATGDETWHARAAFLTPIAKAFGTDTGCAVADLAIQVHGGMGFIEEMGIAQYLRDVRVTTIYEGTNGIQAMDLVGRKLQDGGAAAFALLDEIAASAERAERPLGSRLAEVHAALRETTTWMLGAEAEDRYAGAAPYLRAFALALGGHYLLKGADVPGADPRWRALAAYHIRQVLPETIGLCQQARGGADALFAFEIAS